MVTCKNCGKTLILKDGKCIHCGAVRGEKLQVASKEPTKMGLPPVRTFTVNGVSFNMILVEGGSFYYGLDIDLLNREIESGRDYKETFPLVTVSSFYIGETVVTQALWEAVMEEQDDKIAIWDDRKKIFNPSQFKGKDLPVESVDSCWGEYNHFISKLNTLTATKFRLPNNHEWEFAAKGGNKSKGFRYAGSDNVDEVAWYWGNRGNYLNFLLGKTHSVKAKKPNELGIYDMSGNVAEIVKGPGYGNYSYRGGCWNSEKMDCMTARRVNRGYNGNEKGFRLALSPEEMANYRHIY